MIKRIVGFSFAVAIGWLLFDILRRRSSSASQSAPAVAPEYQPGFWPNELPDELIEAEVEAELEAPEVRELDLAELAFVAGAVDSNTAAHPPVDSETTESAATGQAIAAYCMHCRAKRTMADVYFEQASGGRPIAHGTCPVCGAKMARFLKGSINEDRS